MVSGIFHDRVKIDGVKLETIYDGPKVQDVLRQINFDNESIRRLKI